MRYVYRLSQSADRYFSRLDVPTQQRVGARLDELCVDPYNPRISKRLAGRSGQRSSRVGNLRILYFVEDVIHVVDVTDIGPRGDVYGKR